MIPDCHCVSEKTGNFVNFCYVDPQNQTSIGKKFNCSYLKHLERWGIFDYSQHFVDTSKPYRREEDVVFLSACSDDHVELTEASLNSIRKYYPNQKYILYGLRLHAENRAKLEKQKNVEFRDFDYSKYPEYISNWMQYRFKPIIIAEVLQEYSNVWWIDAHVNLIKNHLTDTTYHEKADNTLESDIVLSLNTIHSNFAVLNPRLLHYIPSNSIPLLKKENQLGSGFIYLARTRQTLEILKWWLLCAFEERCMNPLGATVNCNFTNNRKKVYANCFRYDQSVLNLLLLNKFQNHVRYMARDTVKISRYIPDCHCVSEKTGDVVNFCYVDPQNQTSIGKKFNCSYLEHLENWGIFDYSQHFVDTSKPYRREEDVVFLSACSDDHVEQTEASLNSIRTYYPNQKYILYGLRLHAENRAKLEKQKNVEFRDFDYSKYPEYILNWMQYRFKPIIIAEVLQEYSNVWWMDAHIELIKNHLTDTAYHEKADNTVESNIVLPHKTIHSNFAVLNPGLLHYIPSNSIPLLKKENQLGANFIYLARTRQTLEILKWWLLCALEESCMSPLGATVKCNFTNDQKNVYGNCFRYDQSVLNLLLLNKFQNHVRYMGENGDKFDIS